MGLGRHRNRRIRDARRQLGYGIPRSRGDHQNIQQPLGTDGLHRRDVTKHLMPCQILQPLHQVIRGPEAGIREGGDLRRDRDDCLIQLHQLLQLRQHLPGKGGAVVLTQQLQRGDGRLDLVDPLLDVGPIFAPLPLHLADPLQHGLPGQLQELIVHLLLRLVRHRHDLGEQIPLLQLRGHFQQLLQPFLSGDIAGGKVQGQDKHPGGQDEQDRLNVVPQRQQEQGQSQRAQQIQ